MTLYRTDFLSVARVAVWLPAVLLAFAVAGCGPAKDSAASHPSKSRKLHFEPHPIGRAAVDRPWITDLEIADLNGDKLPDIVACEGRQNEVFVLWQDAAHGFREEVVCSTIKGPAHVEIADVDGDGLPDLLVAGMGSILPSTERTGTVTLLFNRGKGNFSPKVVASDLARVTYVGAGDFNRDGRIDLVVGAFGYLQGNIAWLENAGDGSFRSHDLFDLPGTVHAPAVDLDGDGNLDIVALVSQDSEEVHFFQGDGSGHFQDRILYGSTNRDFGSSGLTVADINGDGRLDIVYTNGDGFDYATPGSRPWHGVQWLENKGSGQFEFHRLGSLPGAYSPVVADLDGDGRQEVVVSSGFNDWSRQDSLSLAAFQSDGDGFELVPLSTALTHLVVVRAADLDGDGRPELVTGAFMFYPPFDRPSRITLWKQKD